METIVQEDTRNKDDSDRRITREVQQPKDVNGLYKIREKDVNGSPDRGVEKGRAGDRNEQGNKEHGGGMTLRKSTGVNAEVERNRRMDNEVYNAQIWTTEDNDDESRTLETNGNGSNVCRRVVETSGRNVSEEGRKCTSTAKIRTGDDRVCTRPG